MVLISLLVRKVGPYTPHPRAVMGCARECARSQRYPKLPVCWKLEARSSKPAFGFLRRRLGKRVAFREAKIPSFMSGVTGSLREALIRHTVHVDL